MAQAVYGIKSVIFDTPVAGSFPTFDITTAGTAFAINAIVKDSFTFNDSAPSQTNIEIEDSDEYFATLNTDKGTEGFTIQTYDLSESQYVKLMGYSAKGENGWISNDPKKGKLEVAAIQVTTKALDEFPSRVYEYAKCKLAITNSGTLGKSGFPNLTIECTIQANFDAKGEEQSNKRWKTAE